MKLEELIPKQRYIVYEIKKNEIENKIYDSIFEEREYYITETINYATFVCLIPIKYPHILFRDLNRNINKIDKDEYKKMKKYVTYYPLNMIKKVETLEDYINDELITNRLPSVIWDYICNFV